MKLTHEEKKKISSALKDAMIKEALHTSQAAKFLNIAPYYLSMAQNEKSFNAMGVTPWVRIKEWFDSREKITDFQIPEGEPIWEAKKPAAVPDQTQKQTEPVKEPIAHETPRTRKAKKVKPVKKPRPHAGAIETGPFMHEPKNEFPETARAKLSLEIEINLVINGRRIQL